VLAPKLKMYQAFMLGAALAGAPRLLILGASHELVLVCAVTFASGLAMSAVSPVIGAMLFERIPPRVQTRAFGVCTAITFTGVPIGGVLAGLAVARFGLTPSILTGGALCAVATTVLWLRSRSLASTVHTGQNDHGRQDGSRPRKPSMRSAGDASSGTSTR
jgi:MFS family permease